MEKFRWCFIGCGSLAGRVAEQIAATGRHAIVSVYARSADRREAFGAAYGALLDVGIYPVAYLCRRQMGLIYPMER